MATNPLGADSALVTFPLDYPPHMAAIARILGRYPPGDLARFVTVAIDLLDLDWGDPDLEEDDEPGQCTEDEISTDLHCFTANGPGCEISDSGGGNVTDEPHDGDEGI